MNPEVIQTPKKPRNILLFVVLLLVLTNLATLVWLYRGRLLRPTVTRAPVSPAGEQAAPEPTDTVVMGQATSSPAETPDSPGDRVIVDWQEWPAKSDAYLLYDSTSFERAVSKISAEPVTVETVETYRQSLTAYSVGKVATGTYAGKDLFILAYREPFGPSFGDQLYWIIRVLDNKSIILTKMSRDAISLFDGLFTKDTGSVLANVETPSEISIPDSAMRLYRSATVPYKFMTDYADAEKAFKYDDQNYLYFSRSMGCYLAKAADGTAREYYFDLPFARAATSTDPYFNGFDPLDLSISWLVAPASSSLYTAKHVGGCGVRGCYNYPGYATDDKALKPAGKFSNGDTVYTLADQEFSYKQGDSDIKVLREAYNMYYPWQGESNDQRPVKIAFEEFMADQPIIYWQDPIGHFLEFKNVKYLPAVECGKPVIYLYPEKPTDVSVKVSPNGGFSKSEPAYDGGWRVLAKPDGELINHADGKTYPYLFWEGRGLDYRRPAKGFVVERGQIGVFLDRTLEKLGLNEKESREFKDFWQPRLASAPYYLITFLPQTQFDELAPLEVSPKPDTIIRVFMDYQPLDQPLKIEEPSFTTPVRRGFTVVEWGGALRY